MSTLHYMKLNVRYAILLIGSLLLFACGAKNGLRIVSRSFEDEIELQQNLVFTFDKDVFPDSLLNRWDTLEYISFSPAVKGKFKWNSASELTFSPNEGFMPGASYTGKLTKLLLKYNAKVKGVSDEPVLFHTAPLRVTGQHISWVRGKNESNVMVQLDLSFNYIVDLAAAANRLKLNSGGRDITVNAVNSGPGKTLSVQFMPVNDKDENTPLKIMLGKGIPVQGVAYASAQDTTIAAEIPSRYSLTVTGVTAQHTGNEGVITVNTSQPLVEANLKSCISLQPVVNFEVAVNDAGFTITSPQFSASQTYRLSIATKAEGIFGGKLKAEYAEQVSFGKLKPSIDFANTKGMYLSAAGFRNVLVNIVNVPEVTVTVTKVYENNIEHFMRQDKQYGYQYNEEEGEGNEYQYYETQNMGDEVFSKSYETSKLPRQNAASILHIDFEDKLRGYDGVYIVQVKSKTQNWLQQSKIICLSDIGLIVKKEKDNVYVFANSIKTAKPLSGVKVTFISDNNQKMNTLTTDGDGVAVYKDISKQAPGFNVGLVTAKKDDDYSFVLLSKSQIGTSRFDVGGRQPNETGLNAMIYPERNLYRPGETIHMSAVVRDEQWNVPGEIPVKVKLTMPNGKEFATVRKTLNEQGSCDVSFSPPPSTMTGGYTVSVFSGNDVLLNTYTISVEEFMPDRMKASLKIDKEEYRAGDEVSAAIQADNLFGTPAAGRNYECELNLEKANFSADKFADYNFYLESSFNFNPEHRNGVTDDKGSGAQVYKLDKDMSGAGVVNGNVMATVFDETGRPVHRYAHFKVYTQPVFVGIRNSERYVSSRQAVNTGLVAVDKAGNAQTANVRIVLLKREWHTVIQQNGSSFRYVSQSEDRVLSTQNMQLSGPNTNFTFTPQQSGEYEIRVYIGGSNYYVSRKVYAYGWSDTQYTSFEVDNEGNVEIKTDKKEYAMGDNVNVLFTTPFEGRMVVTLERDHVIKYFFVDTKNKSASLSFKADELTLPNVYIAATLFRPMDGSDMPLTVAHGFKSVKVDNKVNRLPVKITVTDKSRSRTKQTIRINTTPGAYVTVAAVDEGILQVKNFETPDPYAWFYQQIALLVNSYDVYPWLLPEIKSTLSSTGGDDMAKSSLRVNPNFVNRVKNVSFWSGILQADGGGNVNYEVDVPQFSGDLRVMAVAYKGKGFGSAEAHMKVADPVVISVALPRFLSPKDEVVMPVSMSNTTAKEAAATVTVKVTGPLGIVGSETQTVRIPANREQRAVFNIAALPATGAAKVVVTVKAMGETFTNETEIGIRPPASLQKLTGSGFAPENAATPIDLKNNFIPSSVSGRLVVGKSPLTEFSKHLDDLVQYPHGCVEQTTSAVFPQLYYADLVKSMNAGTNAELNPAYNVQQAINKLQAMQQGDGGMSYWPQGGDESWWGSIYAAHFLWEAKKMGYQVNTGTLDKLQQYMKFKLSRKETMTFFYNGNMKKEVAHEEIPYSLFVLAMMGQSQQATMNYYKAHRELLTLDGKYMLAAAYALSGMPAQSREVLPPAFSGEDPAHCFSGSFYSAIRDEALSLNVLLDIDPNNKQVAVMAHHLSGMIKKERYLNTQEKAFSMLALGKIARMANKTTATATITANGKTIGASAGEAVTLNMKNYAADPIALQVKGKGGYYYFWEVAGISADGSYKDEDSYLKVRRTFFDRDGHEMGLSSFKQNDLIVVRISLEAAYDGTVENIAITDMLPAGFEIENTRLSEMPAMKWIKEAAEPDYRDIRDDRINMFTSASRHRRDYYYMARAVSPGTYQLGPVQADAMYDGNYHSYNGAGVVKISER